MIEEVKSLKDVKVGDEFVLYFMRSNKGINVDKVYFRVCSDEGTRHFIWGECDKVLRVCKTAKNSREIRDYWRRSITLRICLLKNGDIRADGFDGQLYIDAKTPCEMAIEHLKQKKRELNKKIIHFQDLICGVDGFRQTIDIEKFIDSK
jgi:hypothetical protein